MTTNKHTQVVDFSNPNADKITSASTQAPMTNNKQSSVEWFAKESWKLRVELEDEKISLGEYANKYYQLKQQAKAMHKEEIEKSWVGGKNCLSAEQYYNETFGGNNEQQ